MQAQYAITYLKVVQVRAELWRHWLEVDINVWDPVKGSDSGVRCVPTAPAALRHDGCVLLQLSTSRDDSQTRLVSYNNKFWMLF